MGEFGGDGVGHRGAHRRQTAGQRRHHAAPHFQVARIPVGARAGIAGDDDAVGQARRQLPGHALRIDRLGRLHGAGFEHLPPLGDVLLDAFAPFAVGLLLEHRQQSAQGFGGIADQIDFHRIAQRQHVGCDIDLHAARLALLRQELRIGEAGADHQQRVAFGHQLVARLGAEHADRAGDPGQVVGQHRLAQQRLGHAGAEPVGDRDHFVGRIARRRRRPAWRPFRRC